VTGHPPPAARPAAGADPTAPDASILPDGTGRQPASRVTAAERYEHGRSCRKGVPRSDHRGWEPASGRADPIALLEASNLSRVPELVPIRYGRMLASPFAFLRGSATVMAHDLATTATTGIHVQACGDAHLLNFGLFATPERNLVFDVNDFDETLPGPWEWDVKRLAASVMVAGRDAGFDDAAARTSAEAAVRAYRLRIGGYGGLGHMDTWYARLDVEMIAKLVTRARARRVLQANVKKARSRTALQAMAKLTTVVDGVRRLIDDPPVLEHIQYDRLDEWVEAMFVSYVSSLPDDRRHLLERYRFVDIAFKVVGVGSVGTRCYLVLLQGLDDDDVLFLQFKEADPSVLEPFVGASRYDNHGRRVVEGQRLMQAASDIFLGWGTGTFGVDYYFRQFRDMKGSFSPEGVVPEGLTEYAQVCGWALARAHARSGDAAAIAGYLGTGNRFDRHVADFAAAYADQTELDHAALVDAVRQGRVEARTEV
jgi:uncharacterized protein (DUF2252 family)